MRITIQRTGSRHVSTADVSPEGFRQWGAPQEELGKNVLILEWICSYLIEYPEDGDEVQE
ncbi:MAG TPA: hypothetical protein VGN52_24245 [Burkholderiales bacterium]